MHHGMDGIKVQAVNAGHRLPRRRRDDVIVVMEKFLWIPVDVRTVFFSDLSALYVLPLCLEYTVHISTYNKGRMPPIPGSGTAPLPTIVEWRDTRNVCTLQTVFYIIISCNVLHYNNTRNVWVVYIRSVLRRYKLLFFKLQPLPHCKLFIG